MPDTPAPRHRAIAFFYGGNALLAFALAAAVAWVIAQVGSDDAAFPWLLLALLASLAGGVASLAFLVLLWRQETRRLAVFAHMAFLAEHLARRSARPAPPSAPPGTTPIR